ncbi:toxin-antitoxin system YwqK family antitoxin [Polaribacter sp. SA4-12]|uniref:toxin-antitoxin system YwqK family antitoxin n=1 Tax=Polaribacter sp. SA4-12 TaxID=1312072 RepID=UPI000B3C1888|nr:nicotinic acid mononucleotide adenyltransferase [Polaribacter sp. SA4-12]ARV15433.1 nicotinic acid mononucleotide adenyltransferase [Polaribacter sp. SA4-12]
MKKAILLAILFISALGFSQEKETTFERDGDLVKATYYFDNGDVKVQGFFKDKKLTGIWTSFDKKGNKTQIAQYKEGKKTGKWFVWNKESLKEITYNNNTVVGVKDWRAETKLAFNN